MSAEPGEEDGKCRHLKEDGLNLLPKLGVLGVIVAFFALAVGAGLPTSAAPISLTVNGVATTPQNVNVGSIPVPVVAGWNDDGVPLTSLVLSSSAPTVAAFLPAGFSSVLANNDGQTITNDGTNGTVTVTEDADALVEVTGLQAFLQCLTAGTTVISTNQNGVAFATPITVNCIATATTTISFSNTAPAIGSAITVTANCTGAAQPLTSSPTTSGAFGTTGLVNGTWVSASQVNCINAGTMTSLYTCAVAGTVTFTLNGITASITCAGTTVGGLVLSATSGLGGTVSGTCPAVGSVLTQTGAAQFISATINGLPVTVTAGSVSCTAAGPIVATFTCNYAGTQTTVQFALGGLSATFYCSTTTGGYYGGTYPYTQYPYNTTNCTNVGAYPYNTGAYPYNQYNTGYNTNCYNQQQYTNVPTSLTVTSASPSVACGGTAAITVRVVGTNGPVADGTTVSLSSSIGSFSQATATTTAGGTVQATFTAPNNIPATKATLKAISGQATGTADVSVTCAQTTAPSAPSTQPVYTSPPPPPSYAPVITPPSTGDAGLLAIARED